MWKVIEKFPKLYTNLQKININSTFYLININFFLELYFSNIFIILRLSSRISSKLGTNEFFLKILYEKKDARGNFRVFSNLEFL